MTNTPGVLTEDTADMTMALILAVPRRLAEGAAILTSDKDWTGWTPTWMLGHRIGGKKLGIIGMGRIGQAVAARARAFGLEIHYHNRRRVAPQIEQALHATYWESLDQMLARMDIVSVNCPHTPATYHLLSARRLKLMKREAYIVNTARGEIIDEDTLARMIEAGELAGAGLDVFEHEPAVNPRLVRLAQTGKVVLLPHMGSATLEGRLDMGNKVMINIQAFIDGHKVAGPRAAVDAVMPLSMRRQIPDRRTARLTTDCPDPSRNSPSRTASRAHRASAGARPAPRRSRRSRGSPPAPSANRSTPVSAPRMPASAQAGTVPGGGGSGNRQR